MEIPSVRVLVVGDSGVGKTTLLQGACRDVSLGDSDASGKPHRWTIGCDVHVLMYQSRDSYGSMKDMQVEFLDVGGHTKYELSRAMFYHDVQGIVLVHDLSNAKSYDRLRQWMSEISNTQRVKGCVLPPSYSHRSHEFPTLASMPKLVIGNKRDQVSAHTKRASGAPELRGIETMEASAEPFALDTNVFYGFLDRVVSFANAQSAVQGAPGESVDSDFSSSAFSSDGLRQTKTRPVSPSSLKLPITPRAGGGASWWR